MQAGEEREVIVRTTFREMVVYLVFLAILCIGEFFLVVFPTYHQQLSKLVNEIKVQIDNFQ